MKGENSRTLFNSIQKFKSCPWMRSSSSKSDIGRSCKHFSFLFQVSPLKCPLKPLIVVLGLHHKRVPHVYAIALCLGSFAMRSILGLLYVPRPSETSFLCYNNGPHILHIPGNWGAISPIYLKRSRRAFTQWRLCSSTEAYVNVWVLVRMYWCSHSRLFSQRRLQYDVCNVLVYVGSLWWWPRLIFDEERKTYRADVWAWGAF